MCGAAPRVPPGQTHRRKNDQPKLQTLMKNSSFIYFPTRLAGVPDRVSPPLWRDGTSGSLTRDSHHLRKALRALCVIWLLTSPTFSPAQTAPPVINYQGKLVDAA